MPNVTTTTNTGLNLSTLADVQGIVNKVDLQGDAEVKVHFERALLGRPSIKNTQNSAQRVNDTINQTYVSLTGDATDVAGNNLFPALTGVGADYSYGLNNTLAYNNRDYGASIKSGVASGLAVYPEMSKDKSELVQTYIKHVSSLDTQKLVKTN